MDLADDCLAELDIVIASVHSAFTQDEAQMTDRVLRAIACPWVDVIAHPTGRLILKREGYRSTSSGSSRPPPRPASRSRSTARSTASISTSTTPGWRATRREADRSTPTRTRPRRSANTRWGVTTARRAWLDAGGRAQHAAARGIQRGPAPQPQDEITADDAPSATDKLAEIRRLYFKTTRATILRDFDRAIDLIKSMETEAERERATVYMQGLAEMRKEFGGKGEEAATCDATACAT